MEDQTGQPSSTPSSTLLPEPPPVPHYDAVPQEVTKFLKEYFQSQSCLSDTASLEIAQKLPVNGPALFKASGEKIQEAYGLIGSPQISRRVHHPTVQPYSMGLMPRVCERFLKLVH